MKTETTQRDMNTRPELTDEAVWTWVAAGCNAAEIAAYAGISESTAKAWMAHARCVYARAE